MPKKSKEFYDKPYNAQLSDLIKFYKTDIKNGLTESEANKRLKKYGPNKLPEKRVEPLIFIFLHQFKNPIIYILLVAAIINFFSDRILDGIFMVIILFINALVGAIQEGRAQNIMESLKKFVKTEALVLRDGKKRIIEDDFVVPGDIIILKSGYKVPADARIIKSEQIVVDEALLTGESSGVEKIDGILNQEQIDVFEQKNMLFKGTNVLFGEAIALVTSTGLETEIGKINKTIESVSIELPLKSELKIVSRFIVILTLSLVAVLFFVGLYFDKSIIEIFFVLTALLVSVIPESLPIVFTISLAYGAYSMAKKNILVKKLQAVDALGRTEVMVIDKTGTLTRNEMMVSVVYAAGKFYTVTGQGYSQEGDILTEDQTKITNKITSENSLYLMGVAGLLLNNSEVEYSPKEKRFKVKGEPTEAAMYIFSKKLDLDKAKEKYELVFELHFSSETKYHAGFFKKDNNIYLFLLGSPEVIFDLSKNITEKDKSSLKLLLNQGLRMVGGAYKKLDIKDINKSGREDYFRSLVKDLEFLGLFAIQDAIRENILPVVQEVKKSKIQIVMATGDHKQTALYVAKKVGIFDQGDNILTGSELRALSQEQLIKQLPNLTVCARVTPEDKVTLIKGFHEINKIVSMTGDGVNDVPSILAADVGVAMGQIGTEVAKSAADIVLLDDSFISLVDGIEWGRHIYFTIRRTMLYLFATNLGEALLITFALLLNFDLPLNIRQILLINIITDGSLDIGLIFEPKEKHLIKKPFSKTYRLLDAKALIRLILIGLLMSVTCLILFIRYEAITNINYARTITFLTMAIFQWFNAWNSRSEDKSIFALNLFANKALIIANLIVFIIVVLVIYVSYLQYIFGTVALNLYDWLIATALASTVILFDEIRKSFLHK